MMTRKKTPDFPKGTVVITPYGEGVVAEVALEQRAYSVDVGERRHAFQFGDARVMERKA